MDDDRSIDGLKRSNADDSGPVDNEGAEGEVVVAGAIANAHDLQLVGLR